MTRNKAFRRGLILLTSLLASVLAGVVLMTAVYALPTARMRHHVEISLPYILSEGDRYQWAPYHNGTELDGLDYIIARKVLKKFESLNVSFVRDEIKGLIEYIEKTFGKTHMEDSKSYLIRIQNMY